MKPAVLTAVLKLDPEHAALLRETQELLIQIRDELRADSKGSSAT